MSQDGAVPSFADMSKAGQPQDAAVAAPLDWEETLQRVDGDMETLEMLVSIFLEDGPMMLRDLGEALDRQDPEGVGRFAHSLKGSVGIFGARKAVELAFELEQAGKQGDLARAQEMFALLAMEIGRLKEALAEGPRKDG